MSKTKQVIVLFQKNSTPNHSLVLEWSELELSDSHFIYNNDVECKTLNINLPMIFEGHVKAEHCTISKELFFPLGCDGLPSSYDTNHGINIMGQVIFEESFHCGDVKFV